MAGESTRAVMAALLGNAALAVLKGTAATLTGSSAMLAETFHSVADTGNQALLFLGMRLGRRPPDRPHPFGHGKNVYFWAFVVSMLLFSVGGAFAIWEAVRTFLHRTGEHGSLLWAYGVLAGAFVFEAISLGVALHSLREAKGNRSVRRYWRENRDPTIPTVVLEDSAALISIVVAAAGLALSSHTGSVVWDGVASGVIGVILITVAVLLAVENHSLLIGERAAPDVEARIREEASADADVVEVMALSTMHLGPHAILVTLGIRFRPELTAPRVETAIERLQARITKALEGSTDARLVVIEATRRADTPGKPP
jgi:cation diffusion facilitator family transporter